MSDASPICGLALTHRIASAAAVTFNPPLYEFPLLEKEDQASSRFAEAVNVSLDLFEFVVSVGVVDFQATTMLDVHVVEKLRDLGLI
jgi:hypothetical protein